MVLPSSEYPQNAHAPFRRADSRKTRTPRHTVPITSKGVNTSMGALIVRQPVPESVSNRQVFQDGESQAEAGTLGVGCGARAGLAAAKAPGFHST